MFNICPTGEFDESGPGKEGFKYYRDKHARRKPWCGGAEGSLPCNPGSESRLLLRGAIVNRAYGTHKNLSIPLFLLNKFWSYLLWSPVMILTRGPKKRRAEKNRWEAGTINRNKTPSAHKYQRTQYTINQPITHCLRRRVALPPANHGVDHYHPLL